MSEGFIKIFGIILFSGLLAYIGDMVGFRMGKKKISIYGLRPRQTATLITISFGIIITIITLAFATIISEDVRVALFKMEEIKTEIRKLTEINDNLTNEKNTAITTIKNLNDEIIERKTEIRKLREFYRELRQSVIVFEVNEMISFEIIEANTSYDKVVEQIKNLFAKSYWKVREAGIQTRPQSEFFEEYNEDIEEKAQIIANSPVRFFLKTVASSNLTLKSEGNEFDMIAISEIKIIEPGSSITSPFYIDGAWDMKAVFNAVNIFFSHLEELLKERNALINTDYFVHPVEIYDISQTLKTYGRRVYLKANFKDPVYSLGPFNFQIEFVDADSIQTGQLPATINE
ncbi:MAG: DUF3084 domain-containing protein [Candidatus Muiribacteriota bacterium]